METITYSPQGEILNTPSQVIAGFCTAYTCEEAQEELWKWIQPVLLDSFREQDPERTNKLAAFFEHLEQLINAVYILRQMNPWLSPQERSTSRD